MRKEQNVSTQLSFESIARARFYQFTKEGKNRFINFLRNERLKGILKMVCGEVTNSGSCMYLEIGCASGYFSFVLSLRYEVVGLDISKSYRFRFKSQKLNFIYGDMNAMPFQNNSMDTVICISVLEHCKNLENSIRKIKDVLKKDGVFITGYPIETDFFKSIWKRINPKAFRFIDQTQTFWCNPFTRKQEGYWDSPFTHKQNYQTIRRVLRKHFKILQRQKLPFTFLPDITTYYECIKCTRMTSVH